jgi:hypothetical protein
LRADQEGDLAAVLGQVPVAQPAATGAQDERPVPPDQGREGGLVTVGNEAFQQLSIGQAARLRTGGEMPNVADERAGLSGRHSVAPLGPSWSP